MRARKPVEELTVAEVMATDLLTIATDDSVIMAWELMCQAGVHHLPVVDQRGRLVGVIDAQTVTASWDASGPHRARRPVTAVLPRRAGALIGPAVALREAARELLKSGTDHLAVVGEDGALLGLLTVHDLIKALAGAPRRSGAHGSAVPSLYRLDPVLPEEVPAHPGQSVIGPD